MLRSSVRTASAFLVLGIGVVLASCGSDGDGPAADGGAGDGAADGTTRTDATFEDVVTDGANGDADAATSDADADVLLCPAALPGVLGGTCASAEACGDAGDPICLRNSVAGIAWPAQGYCVHSLGACSVDEDCGTGNVCADILGTTVCLAGCGSGSCACPDGQACTSTLFGASLGKQACLPGNANASDGDPCATFGNCRPGAVCQVNVEHPGGECMQIDCTVGENTTCTHGDDSRCVDTSPETTCHDGCVNDADCRLAEGYKCFDPGDAGGVIGRYCRHPQIGDACSGVADCGDGATWTCQTGAGFPSGMCTLAAACPTAGSADGCVPGAVCHDFGAFNACVDRCPNAAIGTQGPCRTGYECTDVLPGGGSVGGCLAP